MNDPKRWSEDAGALSGDERRLLRAGLEPRVPRGAKRAVWVGLSAQLPSAVAAATTAGATGAGTAGALTSASLFKAAGVGILLGATTVTAVTVVEHRQTPPAPAPTAAQVARRAVAPVRNVETRSTDAPARAPELSPAPPNPAPPEPSRARAPVEPSPVTQSAPASPSVATFPDADAKSQPDPESRKVASARSLLRSGQARAALMVLEEARRGYPNGALAQEREALSIESLRALGDTAEARRRAAAFLARYPTSPHAALARRALE